MATGTLLMYSSVHLTTTGCCLGNFAAHKIEQVSTPIIYFHCFLIQLDHLVDKCIMTQKKPVQYIGTKIQRIIIFRLILAAGWRGV